MRQPTSTQPGTRPLPHCHRRLSRADPDSEAIGAHLAGSSRHRHPNPCSSSGRSGHDLAEGRLDMIIDPVSAFGRCLAPTRSASSKSGSSASCVPIIRKSGSVSRSRPSSRCRMPSSLPAGGRGASSTRRWQSAGSSAGGSRDPAFPRRPGNGATEDVVLTVGERIVGALGDGLRVLAPPIALPHFTVETIWHERHHADPACAWFRRVVAEVAKGL